MRDNQFKVKMRIRVNWKEYMKSWYKRNGYNLYTLMGLIVLFILLFLETKLF